MGAREKAEAETVEIERTWAESKEKVEIAMLDA